MSSAFKTLKTSDITVAPYRVNKTFTIESASFSTNGITVLTGICSDIHTTGSVSQEELNYRSIRQLYYSHNRPNLTPLIPLSQQNYFQLAEDLSTGSIVNTTLIYDNFVQSTAAYPTVELENRSYFPTASGDNIKVISIPVELYGEEVQPGSFILKTTKGIFIDDGNGNLLISGSTSQVGNLIYAHGLVIFTNEQYSESLFNTSNIVQSITLNSTLTIYENQVRCHLNENEFNLTLNPTVLADRRFNLGSTPYSQSLFLVSSSYTVSSSVGTLSTGGLDIGNHGDDSVSTNIGIGFTFKFYDTDYTTVNLTSNGNLQFGTSGSDYFNEPIPTSLSSNIGPAIFPYWVDQITTGGSNGIYTQTTGTTGSRVFSARWETSYYGTTASVNYEVRLYEGSGNIELIYGTIDPNIYLQKTCIGIQRNKAESDPLYYNQFYYDRDPLFSGTKITYSPIRPDTGSASEAGTLADNVSGSNFTPYATTIGLYSAANELLAIGKLSQPYPITPNTDITFVVKYDS